MIGTLYRPLSTTYLTWAEAKITDIYKFTRYNYKKQFYDVGVFTVDIPANEPSAELLDKDLFLFFDTGDYMYITDIIETERVITIKGYDLKYLLAMRISLYTTSEQEAGTYGYYVTSGTTEHCIKDIVNFNITNASDTNRQIYGFDCVSDSGRGLASDKYMTRLEPLHEVVGNLCSNAKIGYEVYPDFNANKICFDIVVPTDHTDNQSDNVKVVFAKQFKNAVTLSRESGVSALKNALYTINGNGDSAVVTLVNRDNIVQSGIARKETSVNVNCDTDEVSAYAHHEAEEYIENDSFEMDVSTVDTYKVDWDIGDKVTFKHKDIFLDTNIISVEVDRTADKYKLTLTTGTKAPTAISNLSNIAARADKASKQVPLNSKKGGVGWKGSYSGNTGTAYAEVHNDKSNNVASAKYAFAEGYNNKSLGDYSHSEGANNVASSSYTHAEGANNRSSNFGAHSEGNSCVSSGITAHSEGTFCTASGYGSHAENYYNTASGYYSHAGGQYSVASQYTAFCHGFYLLASSREQTVFGRLNVEDTIKKYALIIGGGSDPTITTPPNYIRKNILTLDWDGNLNVSGAITASAPLPIANGGTGADNADEARTNLGVTLISNTDIEAIMQG